MKASSMAIGVSLLCIGAAIGRATAPVQTIEVVTPPPALCQSFLLYRWEYYKRYGEDLQSMSSVCGWVPFDTDMVPTEESWTRAPTRQGTDNSPDTK